MNKWTKEAPKEPGWYWMRTPERKPEIVDVFFRPGHKYLVTYDHYFSDYIPIVKMGAAEWAGPIELPEGT